MDDEARDPAALERLLVQRNRLADRMRPPWWYLAGVAVVWALVFASPFSPRVLPQGMGTWAILVAALALAGLLQWGLGRATGIVVGFRDLRYRPGRPARIMMIVVGVAVIGTEAFLIRRDLLVAAFVIAALAVVVEVVGQEAALHGIRQHLRTGQGPA